MDMTGSQRIAAPPQRVWEALNDPQILKACIPGCESIDKLSDTEMQAKLRLKIGPVSAAFSGKVTLSDLDPPHGYSISGEGSGGGAGFAKGGAKVRLTPQDGGATQLDYTVHSEVGGKIAQLGARLIDQTAKKLAGEFFQKLQEVLAPQASEMAPGAQVLTDSPMAEALSESQAVPQGPIAMPAAASAAAAQIGRAEFSRLEAKLDRLQFLAFVNLGALLLILIATLL